MLQFSSWLSALADLVHERRRLQCRRACLRSAKRASDSLAEYRQYNSEHNFRQLARDVEIIKYWDSLACKLNAFKGHEQEWNEYRLYRWDPDAVQ